MEQNSKPKQSSFVFHHRTRFVILALSTVCLAFMPANVLVLNFTFICMDNNNNSEQFNSSTTTIPTSFTAKQRSLLISANALGALLATQPITWATAKFGSRLIYTISGAISAITTFLNPLVKTKAPFSMFFALRLLQGTTVAMTFPAMGIISGIWSSLDGNGFYISILTCCLQIAPILVMPISGAFCTSPYGWSGAFYLFSTITVFLFALFFCFYRDSPKDHRCVSLRELNEIECDKIELSSRRDRHRVPISAICTTRPVLGLWASSIGGYLAFQLFYQFGPIYLHQARKFSIEQTSIACALPHVTTIMAKFLAGPILDRATCVNARLRLTFFTVILQSIVAGCLIVLALLQDDAGHLTQAVYTVIVTISSLHVIGIVKATHLVAQHHADFVLGVMTFINWLDVLLLPGLIAWLAPNDLPQQWAHVFYVIAGVVVLSNVFFACQASELRPAIWTIQIQPVIHHPYVGTIESGKPSRS